MQNSQLSDKLVNILVCPDCRGSLKKEANDQLICQYCSSAYNLTKNGNLDLRLQKPKAEQVTFNLGEQLDSDQHIADGPLKENPDPELIFDSVVVPHHLSKELISYFPKAHGNDSLVLDLGCGNTVHKEICEYAGFEYVGLDYADPKAPLLGDAHALPFHDGSFEFVLSIAVLEHIQYPFPMIKEVFRVLKHGGIFIGTVSFLEPFHGNSYYHFTHLGLFNLLCFGGFEVNHLAPNKGWNVFDAQARMAAWALFPGLPRTLSMASIRSPQYLSNAWHFALKILKGKKPSQKHISVYAGSFSYIANKKDDGVGQN